jgi:hypothetical protein
VTTSSGLKPDFFARGIAEFTGVPVGPLRLTATPAAIGKPSSTVDLYVADRAVTIVGMFPTP